ncbi:MAG: SAM-dependent methyltransferase, partial [Planctomycetota bacterium]
MAERGRFVGRGGEKLEFALDQLRLGVSGLLAADFGCNVGGFTDCFLHRGARRVYAVDTGYGMLAWKLRQDERVVVMERTNAMHVELPEPVDVVAVDVGWTKQRYILPNALKRLDAHGSVLSLLKPQYEAPP